MRAQKMAVREPERILHVARRMSRRNIQRVEVVLFGFHFRAVQNRETKRSEKVFDFVLNLRNRMQASWANAGRGQRDINPLFRQALAPVPLVRNACFLLS